MRALCATRSGSTGCLAATAAAEPGMTSWRDRLTWRFLMPDRVLTDHDDVLRPKGSRIESAPTGQAVAEGAADRAGMLDAEKLLGLQRSAGNAGVTSLLEEERSPVHDVVGSGGRPLEPEVRADMEGRLGHDFSDVRVHDDSAASASAAAVGAHAYTVGSSVVFQRDAYDPSSTQGRTTLAHELTHVVQQRQGAVDGTDVSGGIRVSDPSDRFEREAAATAAQAIALSSAVGTPVQRHPAENGSADDLAGQDLAIQREVEEASDEARDEEDL